MAYSYVLRIFHNLITSIQTVFLTEYLQGNPETATESIIKMYPSCLQYIKQVVKASKVANESEERLRKITYAVSAINRI